MNNPFWLTRVKSKLFTMNSQALLSFTIKFVYLLVLYSACTETANAQVGCQNLSVPHTFSSWNWEETPYDASGNPRPAYCNTWAANIAGQSSLVPMDAPWVKPGGPGLVSVSGAEDYKKADGWELLRFDFGYQSPVPVPYFILYHKPTGVLRVYAYIVQRGLTGAVITLNHSTSDQTFSGYSIGSLGNTRDLVQAPDKYLTQSSSSLNGLEQTTYVCFLGGQANWTMAQFTMLLDPNWNNTKYNRNAYQIQIRGLIKSTVMLDGAIQFKTNTSEDKDFSFSGPAITPTKPSVNSNSSSAEDYDVTGKAQKFLGDLESIGTKIQDIGDKADKTAKAINATTGPLLDIQNVSNAVKKATANSTLSAITGIASQLGGIFGLAGSIIGLFTSEGNSVKSAFIPTVSKGTITLKGTITTDAPLHTFFLLVPGGIHYDPNSNSTVAPENLRTQLPYYNCPLGIFNIANTPVLYRNNYQRTVTEYLWDYQDDGEGSEDSNDLRMFSSYMLAGTITPVINASSGLEINYVKIAIAQKIPASSVADRYFGVTYAGTDGLNTKGRYVHNFLYSQIVNGVLEVYPYDPGKNGDGSDATIIVQTPFVDASCSASTMLGFNIPTPTASNPVFLRVIAELHKVGSPSNSAPVYFAQDYAVDFSDVNTGSGYSHLNNVPLFGIGYAYGYTPPSSFYSVDKQKTGNLTYNNSNRSEIANQNLTFDSNAAITIQKTSNNLPVLFDAASSIGIDGSLDVDYDSEITISTSYKDKFPGAYDCNDRSGSTSTIPTCTDYENRALRPAVLAVSTATEETKLSVTPNPAISSALVQLSVPASECIQQIALQSVEGRLIWNQSLDCSHKLSFIIPVTGLSAGIYIVRVTTSNNVYASKMIVE